MSPYLLESDLVADIAKAAAAMNAFVAFVGQRKAKGSGTTLGFPDAVLMCAGQVRLIEIKRPATDEHPHGYLSLGQSAFIEKAEAQGVMVHVVDSVEGFCAVVNSCRKRHPRTEVAVEIGGAP